MGESFHMTHIPHEDEEAKGGSLVESALVHIAESVRHLDHQINIVIGISAAIFVLSASIFEKEHGSVPLFFVMIFAGASALVGLLAVHPPRGMRKRGQSESLLYRKKIEEFDSPKAYAEAVKEAMNAPKKIEEEYATEVYNLCKYYYRPKRKLFHLSRKLLFAGIALSLLTFLIQTLTSAGVL
jgi:hypothetical protein